LEKGYFWLLQGTKIVNNCCIATAFNSHGHFKETVNEMFAIEEAVIPFIYVL
jgi:hypothetical protein